MNSKIQILLTITAAASGSFLQTPLNQLDSTFNSTFLAENERLFKPIIIPNITQFSRTPYTIQKTKPSQESTLVEEGSKSTGNLFKFSSRYSTKQRDSSKDKVNEDAHEFPTEAKSSKKEQVPNLISNRSDNLDEEEIKKESNEYSEESEESDVDPTIEPPHSTFYQKFNDNDSETSTSEDNDSSEEKEDEDKRSVEDYYNSGSKNYHSIQTPLSEIKYQGLHSYRDDRKRTVPQIARHLNSHKWPYSKSQLKPELENLNEVSKSDESHKKELDESLREKAEKIPRQLEIAEEKDKDKFDRNKKYNFIELRNKKNQQQRALVAQEEKDDQKSLFLKQYQVDEEEPTHQTEGKPVFDLKNENIWPTVTTPKTSHRFKTYPVLNKPTFGFQGHQFLGPVVFNQNLNHKTEPKDSSRHIYLKGLTENEKLDQENLKNHRFQKSALQTGSKEKQSFNHLKESDEMYNAILANIQSVFGLRTQTLKSGTKNQKGSIPEVNLNESKALTWSLP